MKNNTQKKFSGGIFIFFIVVILIIYVTVQLTSFLSKDVKIAGLREYTVEDKILTQMLVLKNETVLQSDSNGGCDYLIAEGQKVSVGEKIAVVYKNMNNPELLNNIRNLELQIDSYNSIIETESSFDYDISKLDSAIDTAIVNIFDASDNGNVSETVKDLTELKKLLHKRGLINGTESQDTKQVIAQLQSRLDGIILQNSGSMESVYATVSGFFTSEYDGLEGTATDDMGQAIDVNTLENYLNKEIKYEAPVGYVGTVITGFSWSGVFSVPADYPVNEGDLLKIRLKDYSSEAFYVNVNGVGAPSGGKKTVMCSSSSNLSVLSKSRFQAVEIIEKTYSGLRVTKDAIKTVNSQTGVFIIKGKILDFQPVNIMYSGEDYVIIESADEGKMYNNDDVVTSGKNLYDGKVVTSGLGVN